jgi:hypothetical protein
MPLECAGGDAHPWNSPDTDAARLRQCSGVAVSSTPLSVLTALACIGSPSFGADTQQSAPPSQDTPPPSAKPWYSPLKDIEAGPGKLDIGLNVRTRGEYLDNFNILHYGTGADDDVLLLRTRLSADYRFTEQSRDAWYWVNGKPERRDPTGQAGQDLGHELDVILRWQVNKELELLFGYARFFAGNYVLNTPGNDSDANWAFAQMTFAF